MVNVYTNYRDVCVCFYVFVSALCVCERERERERERPLNILFNIICRGSCFYLISVLKFLIGQKKII